MKKILFLFMGLLMSSMAAFAETIEATPIESLSAYSGSEPYVFDLAARKYYALNNLGQYEEMGIYPEVSTLKVAGGDATEIEYIRTNTSMGTIPYINLNYIPKSNTRIVTTVNMNPDGVTATWKAVFGVGNWANGWVNRLCFFSKGNTYMTLSLRSETEATENIWNQKVIVDVDNGTGNAKVYDATDGTTELSSISATPHTSFAYPLYVFAQNKVGSVDCQNSSLIMYDMKIYEGETLVMDLVAAVDAEGNGGLKDKLTGKVYTSANSTNFALSADGEAVAGDAGISVYPGKLVINKADNHEYKWNGTSWVDLGSVYEAISATNYQDMRTIANGGGWECKYGYASTFGNIEHTGTNNNFFNPYVGSGDWEPYQCKVEGLTKGQTYRVSFNFSSQGWDSWSTYTSLPFFAANTEGYDRRTAPSQVGGQVLGLALLPQTVVNNQPYSFTFTADDTFAVLYVQFGVVNDGKNFYFKFDDLNIEFVNYPEKYDLTWTDPNKYTPLEYIESTDAARENVFTMPYYAKASTEVDIKFQSYSGGNWRAIFSGRNGSDAGNGISLYQNGNQTKFGYFVGGFREDNFADYPGHNQDITVEASLSGLVVNGGAKVTTGQTTFAASTRQISLFANPEWDNAFRGRIYYCTLKEGDDVVYDFQPVMRHDGAYGYYDKNTATFITPVQGNWNGYGYKMFDDKAYLTYSDDTRIVVVGTTAQYLPTMQNLDGATFTYTSADESIATVAADGTVTGVKAGKVIITVTTDADEGWTAAYELTVSEPNYIREDINGVGYAVITGGEGWPDSPLENLIDNDATTKFGTSSAENAWAIMIASEPVAVKQYSFVTGADTYDNPGRTPRSWKLEGSNDNQTWTVIDTQDQNYKAKTANIEETVFTVNGTEKFKFFRFSASDFDAGFQLGEFWINEQSHTWGEPVETAATCTVEGKKVWTCSNCKAVKSEVLPLVAHNYDNGVCVVCEGNIAAPTFLVDGQQNPYTVKFRHMDGAENDVNIEEGWNTADFDDSAWDDMLMPLGTFGVYKTRWLRGDNTFWFRRTFEVEDPTQVATLKFRSLHDDDYVVFVNGTEVQNKTGWTEGTNWEEVEVPTSLLVAGKNVVAVYIEQNFGGAYCDFALEGTLNAKLDEKVANTATIEKFAGATMPVVLDRPLVANTWNTIILPFDLSKAEIAAAFGEGTQVAKVKEYEAEKNNYSFESVEAIEAGVAYLVKPTAATPTAAYTFADRKLEAFVAEATLFVGSFDPQEVAAGSKIVAAGNKLKTVGTAGEIKAFRAYFPAAVGEAKDGTFTIDGDATGIITIDGDIIETTGDIYDLQGRKVNKAQRGVYIVNGKKVVLK